MTVGNDSHHSSTSINFFNFDLTVLPSEDGTEEVKVSPPNIQSPIPQHFISDFPMIAYKSYVSDNNEIVLANIAQKNELQHILKMENWQFICFVHHAMLKEFPEIKRFDSNILFLARHSEL